MSRFQPFRRRCTVSAAYPALVLVDAAQWDRRRCVQCGQFTRRRGLVLVVWHGPRAAWRPRAPQTTHPGHGPWCPGCAHTWWGIDLNALRPDALASDGWRYLGTPVTRRNLRERHDGSGLAHRLSRYWRHRLGDREEAPRWRG